MGDERPSPLVLAAKNAANAASARLSTIWANLPEHPPGFTKDIFDMFDELDLDEDGFVELVDIDRLSARRTIVKHRAAALATLRVLLHKLQKLSDDETGFENDGVTRADLAGLDMRQVYQPGDELVSVCAETYEQAKQRIRSRPSDALRVPSDPHIEPLQCRQGLMGDCYFLAPLVGLALRRPHEVLAMFERVTELNWRVTFPGADRAVTVENPTHTELALFATADGFWPIILEKAYAKLVYHSPYALLSTSANDAVKGGWAHNAIAMLTGGSTDRDFLDVTSVSTTRAKLTRAMADSKIVCVATGPDLFDDEAKIEGLPKSHVYTVMDYDASREMLTLRNPWGQSETLPDGAEVVDGILELSLDRLDRIFQDIAYEE